MTAQTQTTTTVSPGSVIARPDQNLVWVLPCVFLLITEGGYLFTFYDIFDVNASFIQTCIQLVPDCTPPTADNFIGEPILLNLVGYVVGAILLTPSSQKSANDFPVCY